MGRAWIIVGGGPQGVHLAARLLEARQAAPGQLSIVDPAPGLLDCWQSRTHAVGVRHLRSPVVQNLDPDPLSLVEYFQVTPRFGDEDLIEPYSRPSLALFDAHCDEVIARYGLEAAHVRGRATDVELSSDRVRVTLSSGPTLEADHLALALGRPSAGHWPTSLAVHGPTEMGSPVGHVDDPDAAVWLEALMRAAPERVAILGAGSSAAGVALRFARAGARVELIARHEPLEGAFELDPGWLGPKLMDGYRGLDVRARRARARRARGRATVPPEVLRELGTLALRGRVRWTVAHVRAATLTTDRVQLETTAGPREADALVLATGAAHGAPGGALLTSLARRHALPVAPGGERLLDTALRWHPRLSVLGAPAVLELGPAAHTLAGGRRGAERILWGLTRKRTKSA